MAGEAVLSAFMQVLFDKLFTAASNELRSIRGVSKDLEALSGTLSMIQALLEDAEEKQFNDKPVRIWLSNLKDVAYNMDELLDEYEAQHLRSEFKNRAVAQSHKKMAKVSAFFSSTYWHHGLYHFKVAHRIKSLRKKLDKIARERDLLGLQVLAGTSRLEITERPQTSSLVDDSNVFGREKKKEELINKFLLAQYPFGRSNVSILPIVGMGGVGKTTLTQIVYNDSRVKEYFQLRMWVCVSEDFDEMKLTKETLQTTISGYTSQTTNMNLLQEDLRDSLKGKRFLLVLDDVWNENPQKWDRFCIALRAAEPGSKIIVTTQNENVGRIMGAMPPCRLRPLSEEHCWNLFRICAFVDGNSSKYPNLEEIGKEIVKKLKGLPLAAKTLGCLLYSKLDEEDWKSILRSEIWELPSGKDNILPALRLSYKHLPPYLKQCFAFCSVFHKDYIFEKEQLVQIWMALGYIQPQGSRRLEDIGNSYFNDLMSRSFFQSHKGHYVMHDAIHDLAQSIRIGECLILEDNVNNNYPNARHLSYSCPNRGVTSFERFLGFEKLQTLVLLRGYKSVTAPIPDSLFFKLKCLRVLDLCRRGITELPQSVGNLIQLRYLGLSGTEIKTLPSSISKLYNLQTLKLKHCDLLDKIPEGVTNLINLRHIEAGIRLVSRIPRIGRLTSLQELEEFVVRDNSRYGIAQLKDMTQLRGHLSIRNLENVGSGDEATKAQLSTKEYLVVLHFLWGETRQHLNLKTKTQEEVLEGLKPPTQLKELTIKGYGGTKFPSWLWKSSLYCLQTIHLSNCGQCKLLPPLGQLPFLKYLDIGGFGVMQIGQEFCGEGEIRGFPSLNELVLSDMPDLELWSQTEYDHLFPCLTDLEIVDCPKLRELPRLPQTMTRLRLSEVGLEALPLVWNPDAANSSSLSSLQINECPNLRTLQQGLLGQQLKALEELTITDCEKLVTPPEECFHPLVKLKRLHIYNCPKLSVRGGEGRLLPISLEDVQLTSCSDVIVPFLAEFRSLSCLQNLKITNCHGFHSFPEQGLPPSLKSLSIMDCADLLSLPSELQEVSSLETLAIRNCPEIARLPGNGLPETLQELYIRECPLLKEHCKNKWGKPITIIDHIRYIEIDGHEMR